MIPAGYNLVDFATIVAQGRARVLEWTVIHGREVGIDHDLMVYVVQPGKFPGSR